MPDTEGSYDPAAYGERIAGVYDDLWGAIADTDDAVKLLAELAGDEASLELGSGTGRLAIPLADRGVDVQGIEASPAMAAAMGAKPGGERIPVEVADFRDLDVGRRFGLVFTAFNTFFMLMTQDDQVRCFASVARHLTDDGVFVIEAFVPDPTRWQAHQSTQTQRIDGHRVVLSTSRHDPAHQRIDSALILLGQDGIRVYPAAMRYAWPSELDLMARLAGLELRERWGGWDRRPFGSASTNHVSVYSRAAAGT